MEFFEKAHVIKTKKSYKKDRKSEVKLKKELKHMLYGYKNNDNNLINNSEYVTNISDDSASVSGVSDLNLTNSSSEINNTHPMSVFNVDNVSKDKFNIDNETCDVDEFSLNDASHNSSLRERNIIINSDTNTEDDEEEQSLSDELSFDNDKSLISNSMLETCTDISEDLEPFDADGILASKILNKLEKKKQDVNKQYKIYEVKDSESDSTQEIESYVDDDDDEVSLTSNDSSLNDETHLVDNESVGSDNQNANVLNQEFSQNDKYNSPSDEEVNKSPQSLVQDQLSKNLKNEIDYKSNMSPLYVSLTCTDMSIQTLSQVLGDYKYSTIENIPSSSENITLNPSTNIFSTECDDVEMEEAVKNLIQMTMSDDLTNTSDANPPNDVHVDTQIICDESMNVNEDSLQLSLSRNTSIDSLETEFLSPVKVFYGKNNCFFVLKHPAELYIHGKVKVTVMWGCIEIFGYTLNQEPCNVYAPNYSYAQQLKTQEAPNCCEKLFAKLTSAGVPVPDAEDIVTSLDTYDGVVSLQPLSCYKMNFTENNFRVKDLFTKINRNVENCFTKALKILNCSLYLSKPSLFFEENMCWKQVIDCGFKKQSRGIVCGGKGTGKSTFLQYYVNKLLAQGPVLVIDLDPGQCEFTVAGSISATVVNQPLLGPNFTHLKKPDMMLNIGMINTMENIRRYINSIKTLINHCFANEQYQNLPWIINTMGMCNAMGLKFITVIILLSQPTFLLQIDSKDRKRRFETFLNPNAIRQIYYENCKNNNTFNYFYKNFFGDFPCPDHLDYSFFVSSSATTAKSNPILAPRDKRYLNLLAYFGDLLSSQNAVSLMSITPFKLPLRSLNIAFNIKIEATMIYEVINGKVVALCQYALNEDTGKRFTLANEALLCHGHGLVRAIDFENELLCIITPVPNNCMHLVNTLLYADWMPELRGQEKHLHDGTPVHYRAESSYDHKQLMYTPRRRFNPIQFIKMSKQSHK